MVHFRPCRCAREPAPGVFRRLRDRRTELSLLGGWIPVSGARVLVRGAGKVGSLTRLPAVRFPLSVARYRGGLPRMPCQPRATRGGHYERISCAAVPGGRSFLRALPRRRRGACRGTGENDQSRQACAGPPRQHLCPMPPLRGSAHCRAGASDGFRPGDRLSDTLAVFVWSGGADMNVTSHFERLSESACKKASGDRLWCGSCHDPHRAPAEAERAGFYRAKCLQCHQAADCSPRRRIVPAAICRRGRCGTFSTRRTPTTPSSSGVPRPLRAGSASWFRSEARRPATVNSAWLMPQCRASRSGRWNISNAHRRTTQRYLVHLAYLYESGGNRSKAAPLYEKALKIDPSQVAAAVNLGNASTSRAARRGKRSGCGGMRWSVVRGWKR